MKYDLVLKGGEVIDPGQSLRGCLDVAFAKGRIAAIESNIPISDAKRTVDVSGNFVAPGLIDLHTHFYVGVSDLAVSADDACSRSGVTTAVDAGSAGSVTFPGFKQYIVQRSQARILSFVHISSIGLITYKVGEMLNIKYADPEGAAGIAMENSDIVVGIKIRHGEGIIGENGLTPLRSAIRAAEMASTRVMVHVGRISQGLPELLDLLRPGDIVTHCFTGTVPDILSDDGEVTSAYHEARERGVIFDVGHGRGSFAFDTAKKAIQQGFVPDTISTDLHALSIDYPVCDLPTTMSKLLNLGLSLEDVIYKTTRAAAAAIGGNDIGALSVGLRGDAAVIRLTEGQFEFFDSYDNPMSGNKKLEVVLTVKEGKVWWEEGT